MKPFKKLNPIAQIGIVVAMLILGFVGAKLTQPVQPAPRKHTLMVHDYIIEYANRICEIHNTSLHYIVPIPTEIKFRKSDDAECQDLYKIRCQDESIYEFDSGASACYGVGDGQWNETMQMNGPIYHLGDERVLGR